MGYHEVRFGATWKTKLEKNPTTVWFKTPGKRDSHVRDLKKNPIVIISSIRKSRKNKDGSIVGE